MAGAVIEATARLECEDGLWTEVHLEGSWCPSRVLTNPVVNMAPCLTMGAQSRRCRAQFTKADQIPTSVSRIADLTMLKGKHLGLAARMIPATTCS